MPGTTLIIDVTGGTITTVFSGVCAEASGGAGQYVGRTTTTGVVELDGTIEIEIPIVGTETFGPFSFSVPIPELTSALDLGVRSLQTAEAIDGPGPCDDGVAATGDGADDGTPAPDSMDDGSTPATDGADDTGTADDGATDTDPSTDDDAAASTDEDTDEGSSDGTDTGGMCLDSGLEPNDSPGTAELQDRDAPYVCDGYSQIVTGTLDGPDDVDWFSIPSTDTDANGCDHYANIDIAGARVCIFAECAVVGELTSVCIEGTPTMSPTGAPGCCSTVGAGSLQFECDADSSTSIDAQVRVDQGTVCEQYNAVYEHNPS